MNKTQVFLFLVYSSICLSYSAHGHPVHATFAEAQWNPKTFELELSLRVRGIDLESAISKTTNQKVDLEKSKNIDQENKEEILNLIGIDYLKNKDDYDCLLYTSPSPRAS